MSLTSHVPRSTSSRLVAFIRRIRIRIRTIVLLSCFLFIALPVFMLSVECRVSNHSRSILSSHVYTHSHVIMMVILCPLYIMHSVLPLQMSLVPISQLPLTESKANSSRGPNTPWDSPVAPPYHTHIRTYLKGCTNEGLFASVMITDRSIYFRIRLVPHSLVPIPVPDLPDLASRTP